MITIECDLELELEGQRYHLVHDPQRSQQLLLDVPSISAALNLVVQLGRTPAASWLGPLMQRARLEPIRLALTYRGKELLNQSLTSYARLQTLWKLSRRWQDLLHR